MAFIKCLIKYELYSIYILKICIIIHVIHVILNCDIFECINKFIWN